MLFLVTASLAREDGNKECIGFIVPNHYGYMDRIDFIQ